MQGIDVPSLGKLRCLKLCKPRYFAFCSARSVIVYQNVVSTFQSCKMHQHLAYVESQPRQDIQQHGGILVQLFRDGDESRSPPSSSQISCISQVQPACSRVEDGYRLLFGYQMRFQLVHASCTSRLSDTEIRKEEKEKEMMTKVGDRALLTGFNNCDDPRRGKDIP